MRSLNYAGKNATHKCTLFYFQPKLPNTVDFFCYTWFFVLTLVFNLFPIYWLGVRLNHNFSFSELDLRYPLFSLISFPIQFQHEFDFSCTISILFFVLLYDLATSSMWTPPNHKFPRIAPYLIYAPPQLQIDCVILIRRTVRWCICEEKFLCKCQRELQAA